MASDHSQRIAILERVERLTRRQRKRLMLAINMPSPDHPSPLQTGRECSLAVVQWADSACGCGREFLDAACERIERMKPLPDRRSAERCNERGREHVRRWGRQMALQGFWDWHALLHAVESFLNALTSDPTFRAAWTNMAYMYHLFSEPQLAQRCLAESRRLAGDEGDLGDHYQSVANAIAQGAYVTGGQVCPPDSIDSYVDQQMRRCRQSGFLDCLMPTASPAESH